MLVLNRKIGETLIIGGLEITFSGYENGVLSIATPEKTFKVGLKDYGSQNFVFEVNGATITCLTRRGRVFTIGITADRELLILRGELL